ncbi:TetR family transcriptional regulator [Paenibacillus yonginensis]|uniref:TetR family transcriptional regulator n=1 Tax=Paenibacillus yonginensis TaxID=1462996 RepID=A0A1B1MW60_9BACL|nr:TetR/AcrR family transcriptional regulator [Paenibacillus yonginensis]ANS73422.1 TetR family transcriptional regulator [Paenibacillus yonginensis]
MRKAVSRDQYLLKIKPVIRHTKFSQLKIDEIAKYLDISKVTLYKHFSSKDEIMQEIVDYSVNFLHEVDQVVQDESLSYIKRFQKTFIESLVCVIYITDLFLDDLKEFYPHHFDDLSAAMQDRNKKLEVFFESGMEQGIFNRMNAVLFMVQDDAVLRRLVEPSFSIQYDVTLKQAVMDFYQMKKYQLLKPEYLDQADDSSVEKRVVQILQTVSVNY